MAEKEMLVKEKVENAGIFEFKASYSFAHSWFKEEGYGVDETKYSEKSEGDKRSITVEWKVTKTLSDYFKAEHKVVMEITDLTDVEVEIDGKKKKMNKGKAVVNITANLIRDWESKWDRSNFSRFWRDVYNKYIIPSRVQSTREKISGDAKEFKDQLKAFLELIGIR